MPCGIWRWRPSRADLRWRNELRTGIVLAESQTLGEEILYADIDPERARNKHVIRVPGKHEIDRLADAMRTFHAALPSLQ